jgi:hypothetical protein
LQEACKDSSHAVSARGVVGGYASFTNIFHTLDKGNINTKDRPHKLRRKLDLNQ